MKIRLSGFERQTLSYVLFCIGQFSPSADLVDDDGKPDLLSHRLPDLVLSNAEHAAFLKITKKIELKCPPPF